MDNQPPLPTSLSEVETLILALYNPQTAHENIATIQETLQRLQKSPEGWRLAQSLLDRPVHNTTDDQLKFFGALTIIVKLNTESASLSESDALELLQNLLRWLAASAASDVGLLSSQKLCSALVNFFIQFSALWPGCVRHMLWCLRAGAVVPPGDTSQAPTVAELAAGLDWRYLRVSLWFINSLVLEVGKTDLRIAKYSALYGNLLKVADDAATLLHVGLVPQVPDANVATNIQREGIKGLQSWILHAQRLPLGGEILIEPLRALIVPVIACLQNDDLYEAAIELLIDTLSNYSNFFTAEHYDAITQVFESSWGENHLINLLAGDFDFEPLQYALLMLAYGDAKVQTLLQETDPRSQKMLASLSMLLTALGYPVAEDQVFVPALEFWATFIETMLDTMYSDDDDEHQEWVQPAQAVIMEVVSNCWRKIQYPPIKTFMQWDASDRSGFSEARKDVADLLQTVFTLTGRNLLSLFANLLQKSIADRAWGEIEATAFCLASLSDCISDDTSYDELLQERVFSAPLFNLLALGESELPVRLRQTALGLIERYSEYFERHPSQLPTALNLLFEAVAAPPPLSTQASKAIATLCSSCRTLLTPEVDAFLRQYRLLHDNPQLDSLAEERIVTAIAAIIQATSDEGRRLGLFEQLLAFVVHDVEQCLTLLNSVGEGGVGSHPEMDLNKPLVAKAVRQCQQLQQEEPQSLRGGGAAAGGMFSTHEILLQAALISLRCLAGMARGLQATTEPVDLDSEPPLGPGSFGKGVQNLSPEQKTHLHNLQGNIITMMVTVQKTFRRSSEVVDVMCSILKAGFSETDPGPFVFAPEMVTEMLSQYDTQTPYIGSLVNTAYSFASSLSKGPTSESATKSLRTLVPWAIRLVQVLPDAETDTELAQRVIEFIDRVTQKHPHIVLGLEPSSQLEFFFLFTLKVLEGQEPLPKAASADFWTTFLTLRPNDASVQAIADGAMAHLGPLLAESLVRNIAGNASRSELDKLSEPLKKLVVQHVRAQGWLEQALASPTFPSDRVTAAEKSTFLKKIIGLRGARQTNNVVREFWLACRGSHFAFAS